MDAAIHSGYFQGWPGLTASAINHHIKAIKATVQENLNQSWQGLHFTKAVINELLPMQILSNEHTHLVYIALEEQPGKLYNDQTRRFPYTSN